MKLIVDSNRIIASLIKKGPTREIINSSNFEFFTLDYVVSEVKKYRNLIMKKAKMSENEVDLLFNLIMEKISIVPDKNIDLKIKKAID